MTLLSRSIPFPPERRAFGRFAEWATGDPGCDGWAEIVPDDVDQEPTFSLFSLVRHDLWEKLNRPRGESLANGSRRER
jgi:hypothetical protein